MFFNNWEAIYRTLIIGVSAYISIILLLRISGKRTLSKWNAFDFIVTIALGSSLASAIISQSVSLVQGVTAFAVLIFLQLIVTWLSVRLSFLQKIIKAEPTLLLKDGIFLFDEMKSERVTDSEIRAALREKGIADIKKVRAVVLETDGSFSIIKDDIPAENSALKDVKGF